MVAYASSALDCGSAVRPSILIFHCHNLGQHLQCYVVPTVLTPWVDRLAARVVRFHRCSRAAPSCSLSRASLFTGRYPHSNGVMGLTGGFFARDIVRAGRHLAKILNNAAYATSAVGVIHETRQKAEGCDSSASCRDYGDPETCRRLDQVMIAT